MTGLDKDIFVILYMYMFRIAYKYVAGNLDVLVLVLVSLNNGV